MSNFMAKVEARYHGDEAVQRRRGRREQRNNSVFSKISEAVKGQTKIASQLEDLGHDKEALNGWDLREGLEETYRIGGQHPGAAAVILVRDALSEFDLPTPVNLRWAGTHREKGKPPYHVEEGRIDIQAELQSLSSIRHWVDIPIFVHQGRMLHPSLLMHNGVPRVITQNTFDEILKLGEVYEQLPDRGNLFSPPPDKELPPREPIQRVQPGIFGIQPNRTNIRAAIEGWRKKAAGEHIDRAEQPDDESLSPGAEISLAHNVEVRDRGGVVYTLTAGTKGTVVRDMEGDNRRYYVNFPDEGFRAPIFAEDITRG
jgi:hypothetical protein